VESEGRMAEGDWSPEQSISHSDGFDKALDKAVGAASKWGPGQHYVKVTYEARIDVTNPGAIGEYRVKLTEI